MIKLLSLSVLLCFLSACQTSSDQKPKRCLSGINSCADVLGGNSSLVDLISIDEKLEVLLKTNRSKHVIAVSEELGRQAQIGNAKYLVDGDFVFNDSLKHLENVDGVNRIAAYSAKYEGKRLFIKQISTISKTRMLNQILFGRILHALSIGPETHLVVKNDNYYLVMEQLPGINIKEVLRSAWRVDNTKSKIDEMLGRKTKSIGKSRRLFAKTLLNSKPYMDRLWEIVGVLEQNGFYSTGDLQFMIDVSSGPDSIQIIDVEVFLRSADPDFRYENSPRNRMLRLIKALEAIAAG